MFNLSGRDFLMAIVGALLLTIVTAVQGCRKMTPAEMEAAGRDVPKSTEVSEDNVTRISSQLTRTVDTEKNVVCYTYDNPKSLHHSVSCLKD